MGMQQLLIAGGVTQANIVAFSDALSNAAGRFNIYPGLRLIHWLATLIYESIAFTQLEENLRYSAKALYKDYPLTNARPWGFTPQQATDYAMQPEKIANHMYANRLGNGNEASGDGWANRGAGPIQETGKNNRIACGAAIGVDVVGSIGTALLTNPQVGSLSAGWFFQMRGCNELADADNTSAIRARINGPAALGLAQVMIIVAKLKKVK